MSFSWNIQRKITFVKALAMLFSSALLYNYGFKHLKRQKNPLGTVWELWQKTAGVGIIPFLSLKKAAPFNQHKAKHHPLAPHPRNRSQDESALWLQQGGIVGDTRRYKQKKPQSFHWSCPAEEGPTGASWRHERESGQGIIENKKHNGTKSMTVWVFAAAILWGHQQRLLRGAKTFGKRKSTSLGWIQGINFGERDVAAV